MAVRFWGGAGAIQIEAGGNQEEDASQDANRAGKGKTDSRNHIFNSTKRYESQQVQTKRKRTAGQTNQGQQRPVTVTVKTLLYHCISRGPRRPHMKNKKTARNQAISERLDARPLGDWRPTNYSVGFVLAPNKLQG